MQNREPDATRFQTAVRYALALYMTSVLIAFGVFNWRSVWDQGFFPFLLGYQGPLNFLKALAWPYFAFCG